MDEREGFHSPLDVHILWAGLGLWILLAMEIGSMFLADAHLGRSAIAASFTGLFLGREAGIPLGTSLGIHPLWMWQLSATLDLASGATAYGGLLWLLRHPNRWSRWARRLLHKAAEDGAENGGFIARWGRWGVFAFMLVPFMVNGPLVVSMAARMAGISTRALILPVIAATVLAAGIWVSISGLVLSLLGQLDPGLEIAVTGIFLGAMLGFMIWKGVQAKRKLSRRDDESDEHPFESQVKSGE